MLEHASTIREIQKAVASREWIICPLTHQPRAVDARMGFLPGGAACPLMGTRFEMARPHLSQLTSKSPLKWSAQMGNARGAPLDDAFQRSIHCRRA
jgi:hypothetical protein